MAKQQFNTTALLKQLHDPASLEQRSKHSAQTGQLQTEFGNDDLGSQKRNVNLANDVQGSIANQTANQQLARSYRPEASTGLGGKRQRDEQLADSHGTSLVSDSKGGYGIVSDEEVQEKKEHAAEAEQQTSSAYDRMMNPFAPPRPPPPQ